VGAIGFLTLGALGGALLTDFTLGGMDPVRVAHAEAPAPPASSEWVNSAFDKVRGDSGAELADPWKPQAEQAD